MFCYAFPLLELLNSSSAKPIPPSLPVAVTLSLFFTNPTKVCNLGVLAGVQQDILRFEVSVDHHVSVAVVYS